MRGVAMPLASAVLSMCFPKEFVVIDSLLWRSIFGRDKNSFSMGDYFRFLDFFSVLSEMCGLSLHDTEHLLWIYEQKNTTAL
jgi:hypothetical protein